MKRLGIFLMTCVMAVCSYQASAIVNLGDFVPNASFELPELASPGDTFWGLPGWETEGGRGRDNKPRIEYPNITLLPSDGYQYLESFGAMCRLPLYELTIQENTTYTLFADIAVHTTAQGNPAPNLAWFVMFIDALLSSGPSAPLAQFGNYYPVTIYGAIPGHIGDPNYPLPATWYTVSCSFDSSSIDPSLIGKPLRLNFRGDYLKIDNIRLQATGTSTTLTINVTPGAEKAILVPRNGARTYSVGVGWTIALDAMRKYVDCPHLYTFSQWTGATSPTNNRTSVVVNGPTSVTAAFNQTSPGCVPVNIVPSMVNVKNWSFEVPRECVDDVDGVGGPDCDLRQSATLNLMSFPNTGWTFSAGSGGTAGSGVGTVNNPMLAGVVPTEGRQAGIVYRDEIKDTTYGNTLSDYIYQDIYGEFNDGEVLEISFDLAAGHRSHPGISAIMAIWWHAWVEGEGLVPIQALPENINYQIDDPTWQHYQGTYTVRNPFYGPSWPSYKVQGYRLEFRLWNLQYNGQENIPTGGYGCVLVDNVKIRKTGTVQGIPANLTLLTSPSHISTAINPAGGTYNYAIGSKILLSAAEGDHVSCPNIFRFTNWAGEPRFIWPTAAVQSLLLDDDKTITAYFDALPAVCGDVCHPYPRSDFNQDCLVNLNDFESFAKHWLENNIP